MKIDWLGHACFKINDSLVIDPYKDGSVPGYQALRTKADKVVCSHEHADHSGRECVELSGQKCPLEIREIPSWHDNQQGALRGPNTIFIVKDAASKLVHLGDLGHFPNSEQLAAIRDADYLLVPVGGFYTFDVATAVRTCVAIAPKQIIPMHYRWGEHGYPEIGTLDDFIAVAKRTDAELAAKIATPCLFSGQ